MIANLLQIRAECSLYLKLIELLEGNQKNTPSVTRMGKKEEEGRRGETSKVTRAEEIGLTSY